MNQPSQCRQHRWLKTFRSHRRTTARHNDTVALQDGPCRVTGAHVERSNDNWGTVVRCDRYRVPSVNHHMALETPKSRSCAVARRSHSELCCFHALRIRPHPSSLHPVANRPPICAPLAVHYFDTVSRVSSFPSASSTLRSCRKHPSAAAIARPAFILYPPSLLSKKLPRLTIMDR